MRLWGQMVMENPTLLSVIMGHPKYIVTQGIICMDDQNVLE